jgi:hypothetical protein
VATFPKRETEIIRLVHDIADGMTKNKEAFPSPPSPPEEGLKLIDGYYQKRNDVVTKTAGAKQGFADQKQAAKAVIEWAKSQIRYAESLHRKDAGKLGLIGWSTRRAPVVTPDILPGQPGNLEVRQEGKNWVSLSWRDPLDGGSVSAYKIQRRKTGGEWADLGTAVSSETTLNN